MMSLKSLLFATPLTVDNIQNPAADYYILTLNYAGNQHFNWKPGAAGFFTLPHQKNTGSGFRFFSIAAVPDENKIVIGTRTGATPSAYKQVLVHLHAGDHVNLRGPIGTFGVKKQSAPVVMIGSGVGVTPFRAMALELVQDTSRPIRLIQSARDYHLFKNDFDQVAATNPQFQYLPVDSGKAAQKEIMNSIDAFDNTAFYYLSGASKIVKANREFLQAHGIAKQRIVSDIQIGY